VFNQQGGYGPTTNLGERIMSDLEAFTLALRLSVTAPTDELAEGPLQIAQELSRRLTADQVNQAKSIIELEAAQ